MPGSDTRICGSVQGYKAQRLFFLASVLFCIAPRGYMDACRRMNSMVRATWEGAVLAESDSTVTVEGNHYFPPDSVRREFFKPSEQTSTCPWKGLASYYDIEVGGKTNPGAAWYYAEPKSAAQEIKDHVAFWRGVKVEG